MKPRKLDADPLNGSCTDATASVGISDKDLVHSLAAYSH